VKQQQQQQVLMVVVVVVVGEAGVQCSQRQKLE
jgi:hypothetical protein